MPFDLDALEASYDLIAPRSVELRDMFYGRLFSAAPAVRPLFAGTDLRRQKIMLLATLVLLRDLDALVPKLRELGARHVAYGAEPEHYPVVGRALIGAMADVTGNAFAPRSSRSASSGHCCACAAPGAYAPTPSATSTHGQR